MSGGLCKAIQIRLEAIRLTGELLLAKAHSINVLFNNLLRHANQTSGTYFITQ
jgi:hypothetical protein